MNASTGTVIGHGPRRPFANYVFGIGLGLILAPGAIWLWVDPPLEPIWGNSPVIPRVAAVFGFPGCLYLVAWVLYALIQPGVAVEIDGKGLIVRSHPPWTRRATWDEVVNVQRVNATTVAIRRRKGFPIRIFTDMIEPGWDIDAIIELIQRYRRR